MGLIEEVRGVLQRSPSTDTWFALCDLCTLDATPALYEQLEAYTHDHIRRWPSSVLRPVPHQWLGHEARAWLWKSANCAGHELLNLTPDQQRVYRGHGLKLLPYTPMRPGERSWLIAQLLKAPDLMQGTGREPDDGTQEAVDDALNTLLRRYPKFKGVYHPARCRVLNTPMINPAHEMCTTLAALALSQGFTPAQSHDLAFGRTRIITVHPLYYSVAIDHYADVLDRVGDFTHTRVLNAGGGLGDAFPTSWASLRRLRDIDLSFTGIEAFPEFLMVPTLRTITHGPHVLLSEASRRQTRRRVPYVKFVLAPTPDAV